MARLTRRELLAASATGALALAARPALSAPGKPALQPFRFAYFSDTHVATARNHQENAEMLRAIHGETDPAFAINGGDVTEYGWDAEYDAYQKLKDDFARPVYENMGNHDVRWSPQGEKLFRERLGPPYQFFTHGGVFFAVLDTTVPLSHWGHLTENQLQALRRELESLPPGTPVVLALHHWVGRDRLVLPNELDLHRVIRDHNVKLILTGHGHSDLLWTWDTMTCTMNRGLYQGSWQEIVIDPEADTLRLSRYTKDTGKLAVLTEIPLAHTPRPATELPRDQYRVFRLNGGPWTPIAEFGRLALPHGEHIITLDGPPGLSVRTGSNPDPELPEIWRKNLQFPEGVRGEVMAHLHHSDGHILLGTLGGQVLAYDAQTGQRRLAHRMTGFLHATPEFTPDTLFFGSSTGQLRAIRRRDATILWTAQLPGPVYSRPCLAHNARPGGVLVVANHGVFVGFDPPSGRVLWQTPMPPSNTAFAQSQPCTDGLRVYATTWDSHISCLDAETGRLLWRRPCQERTFAFSPAIGSPCLDDDSVYCVANGNGLFRFDKLTGEPRYEIAAPGDKFGHSSPVHQDGRIFAGGLGPNGSVWCVEAKTGEILWEGRTGSEIYDSSPALGNGLLAIGSTNGHLNILRAKDGELLKRHHVGGLFLSTPLIHDARLYSATFNRILQCFDLAKLAV